MDGQHSNCKFSFIELRGNVSSVLKCTQVPQEESSKHHEHDDHDLPEADLLVLVIPGALLPQLFFNE